jgi:tetratricopeptide (TPR) repeat protein
MNRRNQSKPSGVLRTLHAFVRANLTTVAALLGLVMCSFAAVRYTSGSDNGQPGAGEDESGESTSVAAIKNFWAIYHGNEYDRIPEAQAELEAAIELDPDNPTLYALLGATHFWHVGEASRDPHPDSSVLAGDMPTAASLFQKALDLDYYSPHLIGYVNDDHLPGYLGITTVHTGQQDQDPNLIAKGDSILDFAAYQFPEFNNFNRWAAHLTDPRDSETYKKALDSLWEGIDSCIGGRIDRSNPDLKPYLHLYTSVGRKKACWWGNEIAPYSFEGYLLNLGNGLVKTGQIDAAKVIYNDARYAANYSTWPYRGVLGAIAASDLKARAALYAEGDPSKEPPLGVPDRSCAYCHSTVPESAVH